MTVRFGERDTSRDNNYNNIGTRRGRQDARGKLEEDWPPAPLVEKSRGTDGLYTNVSNKCWGHTYLKSVSDETWMATWCHPRRLPLPLLHAEKTKTGEGDNIPEKCTRRQETRHRAPLKGELIVAGEERVESWSEDGRLFDLAIRIRIRDIR